MTEQMKKDIVFFYTNNPNRFGRFCVNLLEGRSIYWGDYELTDQETAEIYQAMREIFPGRKDR